LFYGLLLAFWKTLIPAADRKCPLLSTEEPIKKKKKWKVEESSTDRRQSCEPGTGVVVFRVCFSLELELFGLTGCAATSNLKYPVM
jgi:hypothetical protein